MRRLPLLLVLFFTFPSLAQTKITITYQPLFEQRISPYQYGQFIEYLCDLVPSMWSEKLYDGSFEGLSPYNFVYIKETDFKEHSWYPSGATNRSTITYDKSEKISGNTSLKIAAEPSAPATVGISQDAIYVEKNQPLHFRILLKSSGMNSLVHITLHDESKTLASCDFTPTQDWKLFESTFTPTDTTTTATLSLHFRSPGTLWLENASLMPTNSIHGWRPDTVLALRDLHPGIIRFGGSTVDPGDFEWRNTIGPYDRRQPFRAWGGLQLVGPGLEEFVTLCREVNAEPLICVRFLKKQPKDAADEVEYFNGDVSTPMGSLRAKNGHPEPYHIKYWQVGNEIQSPDYDAHLRDFALAMKHVDPSIKILSSFPTAKLLENAGETIDCIAPHHYTPDLQWMQQNITDLRAMIRDHSKNKNIKIAVTEWNTTAGDAGPRRAMLWSLANALACAKYHNLLHRNADIIEIANRSNLANSFCSGILQSDSHRLYKTPTYYAQQLYATLAGTHPLKIHCDNKSLDLSATLSDDGKMLTLFAVNDSLSPITTSLDLTAFPSRAATCEIHTLEDRDHAGEPDVTNSFSNPHRILTTNSTASTNSASFTFPALSLTATRWSFPQ